MTNESAVSEGRLRNGQRIWRPTSLGPLGERDFRVLFAGRTVSMLGSAMAPIALAFAVLDTLNGSSTDLGIVLASRQVAVVALLLIGGVFGDRLARHRVMVGSNAASGATQGIVAALLLTGHANVFSLATLSALSGAASAFFLPASSGIIPQTVPADQLQQANAVLRLGLNGTTIVGAALGGVIVAATSPGAAIGVDAISFLVAAVALSTMRVRSNQPMKRSTVLFELREGWTDFRSRTWLWSIVLQFGVLSAAAGGAVNVLGPIVAKHHLGGAAGWGLVITAQTVGLIVSGVGLLWWRPQRLLLVATLSSFGVAAAPLALAVQLPLAGVLLCAFATGVSIEIFGVMWGTALQQEIAPDRLSRVSSYDALGSWVLVPAGLIVAGPVAAAIGTRQTLLAAAAIVIGATAATLLSHDVRTLRRRDRTGAAVESTVASHPAPSTR